MAVAEGQYQGQPCKRGHPGRRYTRTRNCVDCDNERGARLRLEHPEVHKARVDGWKARNPDTYRAVKRRSWQKNRERWRIYAHNWRARKRGSAETYTTADLADIMRMQRGRCAYCSARLSSTGKEIDHIVPLSKGGGNGRRNIQLLCPPCNRAKGATEPEAFARQLGALL